jgi:murein DD-endopeptidase MepM/ murein hydrolase activator NlpD
MKRLSLILVLLAVAFVSFSTENKPVRKAAKKAVRKTAVYPVAGKKSNVRDLWGARRAGGLRKHKGIDIDARKGTPVVAITDGIIVRREKTPIGGKTLWLKSSSHPWTAYYAHLDKQLVKRGQAVRKGEVIGTVGNTGNARLTPSHLHFGIKKEKKWVNPMPYVKGTTKVAAPKMAVKKKAVSSRKAKASTRRSKR